MNISDDSPPHTVINISAHSTRRAFMDTDSSVHNWPENESNCVWVYRNMASRRERDPWPLPLVHSVVVRRRG